jgi:dihydroxy-acid dehydratase
VALVEAGDTSVIDLERDRLDCLELDDPQVFSARRQAWLAAAEAHGGIHPASRPVTQRVLRRMRDTAAPALYGGGMTGRE